MVAGSLEQKIADLQHKLAEQESETKLREAEITNVKASKDKELNHFKSMAAQELAAVQAMAGGCCELELLFDPWLLDRSSVFKSLKKV